MTGDYSDVEVILEFINIFASFLIGDKTTLLRRVLKSCPDVEEVKIILRDLHNSFHDADEEECGIEVIDSSNSQEVTMDTGDDASFNYNLLDSDNSLEIPDKQLELDNYITNSSNDVDIISETDPSISPKVTKRTSNAYLKQCVPEDLQSLIISTNPQHDIKFTLSTRMHTQMIVSGYLLKKRRFYTTSMGTRSVAWKCEVGGCIYHALTSEGKLTDNLLETHNHEKEPELFLKKEARYKLIKNLVDGAVASDLVHDSGTDILGMVGGMGAIKQAANRKKRKLAKKDKMLDIKLETEEIDLETRNKSDFKDSQNKLKEKFNKPLEM